MYKYRRRKSVLKVNDAEYKSRSLPATTLLTRLHSDYKEKFPFNPVNIYKDFHISWEN
jgi:hypothetical protein